MGTTSYPAAATSPTSLKPGSETSGVPASLTSATALPSASAARIFGRCVAPLWSWYGISRVAMPKWRNSTDVTRVSSHATMSAAASVASARMVVSPRLPIGVATT